MNSSYIDLLRRHDDPEAIETPLDFDPDLAERRFRSLLPALAGVLGQSLEFEDGAYIQDASFFAQVFLPQEALRRTVEPPHREVLRFSNFGDMVGVKSEDAVRPEVLDRLRAFLESVGYVYVPEAVLDEWTESGSTTWWDRFFEWL